MESKEFLSTTELAEYLNRSRKFVEKQIAERRLPGMIRMGGRWSFSRKEIDRALNRGQLLYPKAA
jgi:excisionase family DNA binding protein